MLGKVKYTCNNCGWTTSIRAEWADIRPKRCMNKKCNTSFVADREALKIDRPKKPKKSSESEKTSNSMSTSKKAIKDEEKKHSRKSRRRKTVQQSSEGKSSQ